MGSPSPRQCCAFLLPLIGALLLLPGCDPADPRYTIVRAPAEIREAAYATAEKYLGMAYEWGGQDHYSSRGIDCSGLVVNCYREAAGGSVYMLPYEDATAAGLSARYAGRVESPARGDLVFMGAAGSREISHVAVLEGIEGDTVRFIDAYSGSGEVERRSYALDNPKIKHFGRALLLRRR